jgi:hypothetical protein
MPCAYELFEQFDPSLLILRISAGSVIEKKLKS